LGAMGLPHAAQMTVLGLLKNMSASGKAILVEPEQSGCHRLSDQLRNVLLH
jgi:hypothetical protein